jgi:hypothetical protein
MGLCGLGAHVLAMSLLAACGSRTDGAGSSSSSGPANEIDASEDAACVVPTEGAPCSGDETPCQPGVCAQYEWFCNADAHIWRQLVLYHEPPPSCFGGGSDASADAPSDRVDGAMTTIWPKEGFFYSPQSAVDSGAALNPGGADNTTVACVNVNLSDYDQSCTTDSDCTNVAAGTLCSDRCSCPTSAINVDGLVGYEQAVAVLPPPPPGAPFPTCGCPAIRAPSCVRGHCSAAGTPDVGGLHSIVSR